MIVLASISGYDPLSPLRQHPIQALEVGAFLVLLCILYLAWRVISRWLL